MLTLPCVVCGGVLAGGEGEYATVDTPPHQPSSSAHHWHLLECWPSQKTQIWEDQTNFGQAWSIMSFLATAHHLYKKYWPFNFIFLDLQFLS